MLDAKHAENMRWMMRTLRIPLYVPEAVGATNEAAAFDDLVYGATLGLIYFRSLTVPMRNRWDAKLAERITRVKFDLAAAESAVRTTFTAAGGGYVPHSSQPYKAWTAAVGTVQVLRPVLQKRLAALSWLPMRKQRTFPQNSDQAVNEAMAVGQNPWCQSDSEFAQLVVSEWRSPKPNPNPVVNYELGADRTEDGAAGKLMNTVLTSKASKFIDMLLEMGEDRVAEALSKGASKAVLYGVRKVPVADLIVDAVKDWFAGQALDALVESYHIDRDRRVFLKQLNWGTYQDPYAPRRPAAGDASLQAIR